LAELNPNYTDRLKVSENRVLGRILGPKRDGVIGGWRKLRNKELHNLYATIFIIRTIKSRSMRYAGHVAGIREKGNACRILVAKSEVKRPLRRHRRKWEDNIKISEC
jgi:hypothetical protein